MLTRGERYTEYFEALIDELQEQHNWTHTREVEGRHFHQFKTGHRIGSYYVVGFHNQNSSDPRDRQAFTEVGLWSDNREKNKAIFDTLEERKFEIEARFGMQLEWHRRDEWVCGRKLKRSAIGLWREGDIDSDECALASLKKWHIENLKKLKEVFKPELDRL